MKKKNVAQTPSHWARLFDREFKGESDRACVILAAAMIDNILDALLRRRLVANPTTEDPLLDGHHAPIGSLSARIDLAYRVGAISERMARDLHIVRKIRNEFAHNIVGCTFESPSVSARVAELMKSSGFADRDPKMRRTFPPGVRGDLHFSLSWIIFSIACKPDQTTPIDPAPKEFGYEAPY